MGVFLMLAVIGLPVIAFAAQVVGALVAFPIVLGFHGIKAGVARLTVAGRHAKHG